MRRPRPTRGRARTPAARMRPSMQEKRGTRAWSTRQTRRRLLMQARTRRSMRGPAFPKTTSRSARASGRTAARSSRTTTAVQGERSHLVAYVRRITRAAAGDVWRTCAAAHLRVTGLFARGLVAHVAQRPGLTAAGFHVASVPAVARALLTRGQSMRVRAMRASSVFERAAVRSAQLPLGALRATPGRAATVTSLTPGVLVMGHSAMCPPRLRPRPQNRHAFSRPADELAAGE